MSAEEALKSSEPKVAKGACSSVNGKIFSAVASINAQVKDIAGDFDHSKISRTNALSTHAKLVVNLELVKSFHEGMRSIVSTGGEAQMIILRRLSL